MKNTLIAAVSVLVSLAAGVPSSTAAEVGSLRIEVLEAGTNARLALAQGSGVIDYDSTDSLNLQRVSSSWLFNDSGVNVRVGGYTVGSYATDYIPYTQSGYMVYNMTTTYLKHYLHRPVLSLAISPTSATEGSSATGTITLKNSSGANVTIMNNLTINLASSDSTRVTVGSSVTIPANVSSASFTVTAVDNAIADGNAAVTISATAGTWGATSGVFTAINND